MKKGSWGTAMPSVRKDIKMLIVGEKKKVKVKGLRTRRTGAMVEDGV